jgi:hypothetical protein
VTYRDDEAWKARMAVLERTAAEVDDLRERLRVAEARVAELEARLVLLEPPLAAGPGPWGAALAALPPYDLGDPALDAALVAEDWGLAADRLRHLSHGADRDRQAAAMARLSIVLEASGDHAGLCVLLERRIASGWDSAERVRLLRELARVHRELRGDAAAASEVMRRARALGG